VQMSPELRFCGCHTHAKQRSVWRVKKQKQSSVLRLICVSVVATNMFVASTETVCGNHRNANQPEDRALMQDMTLFCVSKSPVLHVK